MEGLRSISLDRPVGELVGQKVAVSATGIDGRDTIVYVELGKARSGRVRATINDTATRTPMPGLISTSVADDVTLRELLLAYCDAAAVKAAVLPALKWPGGVNPNSSPWQWSILVIPFTLFGVTQSLPVALLAALAAALLLLALRRIVRTSTSRGQATGTALDESGRELRPSQVSALLRPLTPARPEGPSPTERVEAVRDAYAQLRDDIVYRIENSALFDSGFAPTEAFEVALLAFLPGSPDAEEQASRVESSFVAAREAAQRLGFEHLPETARATARRATLAAATALGDGPEPERAAARAKVAELLGSLALYWLPPVDPDAPQLIGRRRAIGSPR